MKRTVSKDQPSVVGTAMKGVGMGDKEIKGAEDAINRMKEGLQDVIDAETAKPEGLSGGDRTALEEENAPLVSCLHV